MSWMPRKTPWLPVQLAAGPVTKEQAVLGPEWVDRGVTASAIGAEFSRSGCSACRHASITRRAAGTRDWLLLRPVRTDTPGFDSHHPFHFPEELHRSTMSL